MIKAFLLLLEPVQSWDVVARSQRGLAFLFVTFLLPMVLLSAFAEGFGLVHWGKYRADAGVQLAKKFTPSEAVVYETAQAVLYVSVVFIASRILKSLGETFHGRHTHTQSFKTIAYGLSPLFVMRLFDMFPSVSPWMSWWATWSVGVVLCVVILYQGLPRVMMPDPPHAFGLYLMTSLLIVLITGMVRGITGGYLHGDFKPVERLISAAAERLPF
jgi:hypothetical protein